MVPATHLVVGTKMAGSRRESKERLVALGLVPSHVHSGSPPQYTDRRVGRVNYLWEKLILAIAPYYADA